MTIQARMEHLKHATLYMEGLGSTDGDVAMRDSMHALVSSVPCIEIEVDDGGAGLGVGAGGGGGGTLSGGGGVGGSGGGGVGSGGRVRLAAAHELFDPLNDTFQALLPARCVPATVPDMYLPVLRACGMATTCDRTAFLQLATEVAMSGDKVKARAVLRLLYRSYRDLVAQTGSSPPSRAGGSTAAGVEGGSRYRYGTGFDAETLAWYVTRRGPHYTK